MLHTLTLQPLPFDKIKHGSKIIESRLFDEKRQRIQLGDVLVFQKQPDLQETVRVQVIGLLRYPTFRDLMADFPPSYFGWDTRENALNEILQFYTEEQQQHYGVVGIKIRVLATPSQ